MAKRAAAEGTTVRPRAPRAVRSAVATPWLTILWHPALERAGDVAPLPAKLSRLEPELGPPGGDVSGPLADPHVSRKPITIAHDRQSLRIVADEAAELVVDGQPLAGTMELDANALARGIVLELAGRIALYAHLRRAPTAEPVTALVGASDAITALRDEIARVAGLAVPVLISGETGAGKEHTARAVHDGSTRAAGPFVAVNMATLAPTMAAAQLFGHERGAFTGADRAYAGLFEQAHGGTLFLDEIADASPDVQAMLLRAVETGEVLPLGASTARRVDVRVLAASDADLEADVASGEFRAQLLHRLAGYRLFVPPLRDRVDDLGRLLAKFVARELPRKLEPPAAGDPPWLPSAAMRAFARYAWPGNVRELANVARHLAVLGHDGPIAIEDALAALGRKPSVPTIANDRTISDDELVAALAAQRWKTGAAAAALGISRTTLYALIERCPTIRKARDLDRDEILACQRATRGDLDAMSERLKVSKRGLQLRMRELGM